MTLHPVLDLHDVIAWDMDGTLVDGPNAALFRSYIALTPHKRHHVLTFRDRNWANAVWSELSAHGLLAKDIIRSVESCPEDYHNCFMIQHRLDGAEERRRYRDGRHFTREEFYANVNGFTHWKGECAAALGCTILVDDMPPFVLPGCLMHGVEFFNAHTPHTGPGAVA